MTESPAFFSGKVGGAARLEEGWITFAPEPCDLTVISGKICESYADFFRASTSTGIAGTGIGLHLVQHFIAMHGGRMELDRTEGEGSTFAVRLPEKAA